MRCFILLLCSLLIAVSSESSESPNETVVNIPKLGQVRGIVTSTLTEKKFHSFRGIPYAEPPVGALRFKDPLPVKSWGDAVFDGTQEGPVCVQFDSLSGGPRGTEDCLRLNIYTPNPTPEKTLPVMVWIHGGGWMMGNGGTEFYGPSYFLDRNVVLVTINYRLGAIGFLSTEDAEAPGNYGLLDQTLALKWVQDHIRHFGGNPDSVTIFGESAGGASVEFQLISPLSKGLFHRAIAQSGSTTCPWALQTTVGEYTKELAEGLGCPSSPSRELIECLQKQDVHDIVMARMKIALPIGLGLFPIAFGPRVDSERESPFLPDHPHKLISRKKFNAVPFMSGLNANEGSLFAATLATADGLGMKTFKEDPIKSVRYTLGMAKQEDGDELAEKVLEHFFFNSHSDMDIIQQYEELMSEIGFFYCIDKSMKLFGRHNSQNTYYYHYAHRGQMNLLPMLNVTVPRDWGVSHGDELFLMFTNVLNKPLIKPSDKKVSKMLLDLWTSFATDGAPQSELVPGGWQPMAAGKKTRYLNIEAKDPKVITGAMPFESKLKFWDRLLGVSERAPSEEL